MRGLLRSRATALPPRRYLNHSRTLFGFARKHKDARASATPPKKQIILEQDNLFHPLSQSPFPALRKRGEFVRSMAPCPVCLEEHGERRPVQFECPDCGWPTHATEMHWESDKEHSKYCSRLREANEDEHDLRSGRKIWEYELPGEDLSKPLVCSSLIRLASRCPELRRGSIVC